MSGIELFSCDNIETHAAHVTLLLLIFFELCCQLMLNNVIDLLFVSFFFYSLLLGIYGLLGNVVTFKKKQTKWGGCDNIVIA